MLQTFWSSWLREALAYSLDSFALFVLSAGFLYDRKKTAWRLLISFCLVFAFTAPFTALMMKWSPALMLAVSQIYFVLVLKFTYRCSAAKAIMAFGSSFLSVLLIECLMFFILVPLKLIDMQGDTLTLLLRVGSTLLLFSLPFSLLMPRLSRYVLSKRHLSSMLPIIIVNGLFAFMMFKDNVGTGNPDYMSKMLPLLLFLTASIIIYRSMLQERSFDESRLQYSRALEALSPILDDIRSRQHDFRNQLNTLKLMTYDKDASVSQKTGPDITDCDGIALQNHIEHLSQQIAINDIFLGIRSKAVASLLYLKHQEAASADILMRIEGLHRFNFPSTISDYSWIAILSNLVDNALQAAKNGRNRVEEAGIYVDERRKSSKDCIEISASTALDAHGIPCFSLTVRNTGDPIPPAVASRMFQRGYSTKTADNASGRGYGLYNVHRLLSEAGGSIEFSYEGNMTAFTLLCPTGESAVRDSDAAADAT